MKIKEEKRYLTVTIEDVYKILNNGNAPTANDIVNFRRNRD